MWIYVVECFPSLVSRDGGVSGAHNKDFIAVVLKVDELQGPRLFPVVALEDAVDSSPQIVVGERIIHYCGVEL